MNPQQLDALMKKWHNFFAQSTFPLTLTTLNTTTDGPGSTSLGLSGSFLTPRGSALFQFVAVDPNDYRQGYRIVTGAQYVMGRGQLGTVMCLNTTTDPTAALIFVPVFTGRLTFNMQYTGDGTMLTVPWDMYSTGLSMRNATTLAATTNSGFDAVQQLFRMPAWPLRLLDMAYISPDLKFYLQFGGKTLYNNNGQLAWGDVTDSSTGVATVIPPDPGSVHSGYILSVGGKCVKMTTSDVPISLVTDITVATHLCITSNDDGSISLWDCMSDLALSLVNNVPVFTLCEDSENLPPSWTMADPDSGGHFHALDSGSIPIGQKNLNTTTYIRPLVASLKQTNYSQRRASWDYSFNNSFDSDWLIATPENAFGNYSSFEMPIVQQGANDFNLQPCTGTTDPTHPCVALASSVSMPGGTPLNLHAGHSRTIYEDMYKMIISADHFVDITSLLRTNDTPSGEFLAAVRNAITYLSKKASAQNITIRMLFGEPLGWVGNTGWIPGTGPYRSTSSLLHDLTRDIPSNTYSKMKIYLAYTSSVESITWNHSKIIAVDGQRALVGGHNMWAEPYLHEDPVLDVSMKVTGLAAADAHMFADNLWFLQVQSHGDYWALDASAFAAPSTYLTGQSSIPPVRLFPTFFQEAVDNPDRSIGTGIPILSVGREEGIAAGTGVSDKSLVKLFDLATQTIYISAQAISHTPMATRVWPEEMLNGLANALARGVQITIFMSDPSSGSYKGDPPVDVMSQIQGRITGKTPSEINALMPSLKVRSFPPASYWGLSGQPGISNHAKVVMIDKKVFSIGSQNYYPSSPASMSEFAYIVEDGTLAVQLYTNYFSKMEAWALPTPSVPPLPDATLYTVTIVQLICGGTSSTGFGGDVKPDEVYLWLSGSRIWPTGGKSYRNINTGDTIDVNVSLPAIKTQDNSQVVQVWESDWIKDDLLAEFTFHPDTNIAVIGGGTQKLSNLQPGTTYETEGNAIDSDATYYVKFKFTKS